MSNFQLQERMALEQQKKWMETLRFTRSALTNPKTLAEVKSPWSGSEAVYESWTIAGKARPPPADPHAEQGTPI